MAKTLKGNKAKFAYMGGGIADSRAGQTVYTNDIGSPPDNKRRKESHTARTKYGMGDHYGTGIRQPFGKMRGGSVGFESLSKKKLSIPPKSIV